ncbi:MAG: hypothetical protein AAB677_03060 [Patescibacteria group bacterium]
MRGAKTFQIGKDSQEQGDTSNLTWPPGTEKQARKFRRFEAAQKTYTLGKQGQFEATSLLSLDSEDHIRVKIA